VKKPPTYDSGSLTSKALLAIMKEKTEWTNKELLSTLIPKYPGYDKDGLSHRMRQILYDLTKQEKLERLGKGRYAVK